MKLKRLYLILFLAALGIVLGWGWNSYKNRQSYLGQENESTLSANISDHLLNNPQIPQKVREEYLYIQTEAQQPNGAQ